jgi:hypothetical protein
VCGVTPGSSALATTCLGRISDKAIALLGARIHARAGVLEKPIQEGSEPSFELAWFSGLVFSVVPDLPVVFDHAHQIHWPRQVGQAGQLELTRFGGHLST